MSTIRTGGIEDFNPGEAEALQLFGADCKCQAIFAISDCRDGLCGNCHRLIILETETDAKRLRSLGWLFSIDGNANTATRSDSPGAKRGRRTGLNPFLKPAIGED